ncbi:DUF445 domain-containing protein [Helicobacter pametensis]|uniref:DUF445 domain-containing protein n=1 Tax=Helicobacter pametensis TaxID=95149 RepID=UPI000488056C|nr:DUF445 domain-containing protein [Helicobacter pametensis]
MNNDKIQKLQKIKLLTTSLLFVAGGLLYLSHALDLPWLKAISEAALVGGIADWFAVVALFRHPLGLPIPHTAIIPKSKDAIAKNLGQFIKSEFFSKENLRKSTFLEKLSLRKIIESFIEGRSTSFSLDSIAQALESKIPTLCEQVKNEEKNLRFLEKVNFSRLIGEALQSIQNSASYDEIVQEIVRIVDEKFQGLKSKLRDELVGDSWGNKIVSFLTSYDDKVINGIEEYINKLKNPNTQELIQLKKALQDYIHKLFHDQNTMDSVNAKIEGALSSDMSVKILTAILEHIQENKIISTTLADIAKRTLTSFINDTRKLAVTERWIKTKIVNIVGDYSDEIAGFIEGTIKSWNAQEISQKLELEVGKDLQFIRINGMVVGGIIGGVIYGIERFFS